MGDRTTPMKFGPEWLRNLSREPTSPGVQSPTTPIRPVTLNATASNTAPNTSKVLLAKLRYGREEMLALYDSQTAEAPLQLRSIELLYQARGKVPYALNVNFEDDTRDINMRNNPPIGAMSPTDRYGQSRGRGISVCDGRGRGISPSNESRGRSRGYVRQASSGSDTFRNPSWHNGGPRSYPGIPDDDPNPPRGLWNNGNPTNSPGIRLPMEQAEWNNKTPYRKNRQNHTNWRQQQNRDEGEEWRSSDGARRGQEKWEREWPERNNPEKPWTTNRRQWGDNEDALPEWAVENTETCGGTFDSSGAFHGYSNDDTNLPKIQESYPLTRSNTHGSFARSRTVEEGSEEWWASEKAKKLSTKRFDAAEVKFKKHFTPGISEENSGGNGNASVAVTNTGINTDVGPPREKSKLESIKNRSATPPTHDLQDEAAAFPAKQDDEKQKDRTYQTSYAENPPPPSMQKRIEMLLRTEELETSNERGNYKSVMMTPNNNHLRQKHQNIGAPTNESPKRIASLFDSAKQQTIQNRENDEETQQKQHETKLVEDLLDMNLNEELQAQLLNATTQTAGMAKQMSNPGMQMRMNNPLLNQGLGMSQQNLNMAVSQGMPQGGMMRPMGITNSMLNASLGLPMGTNSNMGMPLTSMPSISNPQMLSSNAQMLSSNAQMLSSNPQNMLSSNSQMLSSNSQMLSSNPQMLSSNPQMLSSNPQMLSSNLQNLGGNMQNPMQGIQTGLQPGGMQMGGLPSGMQGNGYQPSSGNMQMPGNMQSSMNSSNLQAASGIPGFQGVGNSSLFMQGSPNTMQNPNDMAMHGQQNMYPMHGHSLQQSASQNSFNAALYGNMMQPPPAGLMTNVPLTEQWYYEDPKKTIQGPFTSKEMYNWYRAGFFNPDLMVRRACETGLRPLATYGIMPFGPMFNQMPTRFDMQQQTSHDNNMINAQQSGLGPEVESLWSQPANDMLWMQPSVTPRDDNNRVNNLSMYLWDQPSGMSNSLLPGPITKDMKTEDDILAQMRATHGDPAALNLSFMPDTLSPEDAFTAGTNIAPNLEELQKLIGSDIHVSASPRGPTTADAAVMDASAIAAIPTPPPHRPRTAAPEKEKKTEKAAKAELISEVSAKQPAPIKTNETKPAKQPAKVEEKQTKTKEVVTTTKAKTKKQKDEKKEDDIKVKDEEKKTSEKRFEELLPLKNKKEDKAKKELDKEKKEWLKEGFTIVKGTEKKETRKREKEEARLAEEAEKKRIEDEKRALIEAEKNRAPEPVTRRQQMELGQSQRQQSQQAAEAVPKKAPWSAQASSRDGLALSDIQRLEREKKLEQMKEQQQMMHAIAQQQAVAAHRDQEIQTGQLGWAKKKQSNNPQPGHSLAEIQAEARLQAATIAAAATAAASEENLITPPPVTVTPWGASNGGGFWDSPAPVTTSSLMTEGKSGAGTLGEMPKAESKPKKKVTVVPPSKKESSPSADFEIWCTNVLSNWRDAANIDIPTFFAFLRDIESPYEVKDYVKCYLGDTKDSIDFSRQFLERRSRLLRVGMVTPSDDLCSPAAAINPRTNSGSDYTEVKSKGKKTKKNKMFKVDSRILGFSVTAAEDRINIGDIDTV